MYKLTLDTEDDQDGVQQFPNGKLNVSMGCGGDFIYFAFEDNKGKEKELFCISAESALVLSAILSTTKKIKIKIN